MSLAGSTALGLKRMCCRMPYRIPRVSLALMACAVFLSASGDSKKAISTASWLVKYKSGALGLKTGQWIRISFVPHAAAQTATTPVVGITSDQLRIIYFSSKAERHSNLLQSMSRSGCAYARSQMPKTSARPDSELLLAHLATPGLISRTFDHPDSVSSVRFVWNDQSRLVDLFVTVNDCEYASFLANVRWFAGSHSPNVLREFGH